MIDNTALFKNLVNNVQRTGDFDNPEPNKNRILKKSRPKDALEVKAQTVIEHTTKLMQFLSANRAAYIDVLNREYSTNALTNLERDRIDAGANDLIRTINGLVDEFKKELKARIAKMPGQQVAHLEAVSDLLDSNLKAACSSYAEQKAIRVQKELQIQKLSCLELKARTNSTSLPNDADSNSRPPRQAFDPDEDNDKLGGEDEKEGNSGQQKSYQFSSDDEETDEDGMTQEEMQMFERENELMYSDLLNRQNDIQQIESKVVKIAELQEIFTEKVLEQKDQINLISDNAVASTENVKDGNEELRKAMLRRGTMRAALLFFLLVMSFTLLFLDWYNE